MSGVKPFNCPVIFKPSVVYLRRDLVAVHLFVWVGLQHRLQVARFALTLAEPRCFRS